LEITINLGFRDHPHRLHAKDPWKGPMSSLEPGQNLGFGLTSAAQSPSLAPSGVLLLLGLVEPSYWKTTPPPSLPSCCFPLQPKVQVRVREFWVWRGTERGYGFRGPMYVETKSPATIDAIIADSRVPPSCSVHGWGLTVAGQRFWGFDELRFRSTPYHCIAGHLQHRHHKPSAPDSLCLYRSLSPSHARVRRARVLGFAIVGAKKTSREGGRVLDVRGREITPPFV